MEAMIAMMVVTIALTAFLGLMVHSSVPGTDEGPDIPTDFIKRLRIENGSIVGDIDSVLQSIIDKNEYSYIRVTVDVAGPLSDSVFVKTAGTERTDNVDSENGTVLLITDDGRELVASFEVVVWY